VTINVATAMLPFARTLRLSNFALPPSPAITRPLCGAYCGFGFPKSKIADPFVSGA